MGESYTKSGTLVDYNSEQSGNGTKVSIEIKPDEEELLKVTAYFLRSGTAEVQLQPFLDELDNSLDQKVEVTFNESRPHNFAPPTRTVQRIGLANARFRRIGKARTLTKR
ncbi:hypothetical protein CMO88_04840 [Candidatus Woesearchaeota archaeon]|nr:hypothetical protein [Candidatus Woesearchaeota archaeon]|tara:strand:+ start:4946 stop:5275 length:330 start_codon:yes stop_codon:yes gene_type:complete